LIFGPPAAAGSPRGAQRRRPAPHLPPRAAPSSLATSTLAPRTPARSCAKFVRGLTSGRLGHSASRAAAPCPSAGTSA